MLDELHDRSNQLICVVVGPNLGNEVIAELILARGVVRAQALRHADNSPSVSARPIGVTMPTANLEGRAC